MVRPPGDPGAGLPPHTNGYDRIEKEHAASLGHSLLSRFGPSLDRESVAPLRDMPGPIITTGPTATSPPVHTFMGPPRPAPAPRSLRLEFVRRRGRAGTGPSRPACGVRS